MYIEKRNISSPFEPIFSPSKKTCILSRVTSNSLQSVASNMIHCNNNVPRLFSSRERKRAREYWILFHCINLNFYAQPWPGEKEPRRIFCASSTAKQLSSIILRHWERTKLMLHLRERLERLFRVYKIFVSVPIIHLTCNFT